MERDVVQDPNARADGNAPVQQLAVTGIAGGGASGRAPQTADDSLQEAISKVTQLSGALSRKRQNADFIEGRMASMAGKTQEEVAAEGNRTTMAGFVSLEVSNAVSEWQQAEQAAATTEHYGTDPSAYRKHLSEQAAGMIAQMGGDDFAEEQLTEALAPTMDRLAAAQAQSHAAWTQQETVNSYTNSLMAAGQYAASEYEYSTDGDGAVTGGGDYRAFAAGISNTLIGVESGGNPNARNPNSSAEGLGQFIDSTWVNTVRRYRPDLARGKSNAELLEMKTNPQLSRQMSIEYTAEMARSLSSAGLPVTPGNTYLAYFSGPGGARRVLNGDPNAPVSTTLTQGQINANKSVVYQNGRLITNRELRNWADRKMRGATAGGPAPEAPSSAAPVTRAAILNNPGLPPDVHRTAVVQAISTSLANGDGSLWQTAGGVEGLSELNLSAGQVAQLNNAHRGFEQRRQNEYNMEYERERHNLLRDAASGNFTDEEMFERLESINGQYGSSDAEMRRIHAAMQETLDNVGVAEALDVWDDPERQLDVIEAKNAVLDGTMTAEEAMQDIIDIGEMYGADPEATEKAVSVIMGAYDRVRETDRREVAAANMAGNKERETRERAAALISRNVLGTGSKEEQAAGVAILEETLMEDLAANGTPPQDIPAKASETMAKVLVQNDVIDTRRASMIRAAMINPVDGNGEATAEAVQAMAFYMDLKHTGNASPEYLARMFKGNERTLEVLMAAEAHLVGDANLDMSIARAWDERQKPVTQARVQETLRNIDQGTLQQTVKENIISNSGLNDTFWNNTMNLFNSNWANEKLDEEGRNRIMNDAGIDLVVEQEVRSAVSLYPHANEATIAGIVTGQMADRGAIIGSSFVMAPVNSDMRSVMGLNSTEPTAANEATVRYVMEHGEEMFGPAVWNNMKPGLGTYAAALAVGGTLGEASRAAGFSNRPEFVVELIGENMVITPASSKYAFDGIPDAASLPEATSFVVPAKEIGEFYNSYQTQPRGGLTNSLVDLFRPDPDAPEYLPRGQQPSQ